MKLMKIFVDDRGYDSEDGFTLFTDNPFEIDLIVGVCVKNGFEDIRISPANSEEILKYNSRIEGLNSNLF